LIVAQMNLSDDERERRSERARAMNAARRGDVVEVIAQQPYLPVTITRFALPDLDVWGVLLMERLMSRFPHLNDRMFIGWLKGCMESNEFLFVRSEHAVALAQIVRSPLQPMADVQEVFVLMRGKGGEDEGLAMYDEFRHWAERMGARDLLVDIFTDVPKDAIQRRLGRLYNRIIPFIRLNG
jgi:hypothetical protein